MNGKIRAISALCLIAMTAAGCAQNTPAQTETTQAATETESSEKVLEETEETAQTEETTAEVTEMTETEEQTPDETETNDSAKLELPLSAGILTFTSTPMRWHTRYPTGI